MRLLLAAILGLAFNCATSAIADPGKPVAVRWWGQGMVSIETWWNLHVVIDPYNDQIGYDIPELSADLVLVTHEHFDHNHVEAVGGEPHVARGLDGDGQVVRLNQVLDRRPSEPRSRWSDARTREARSSHAVTVTSIPAWHDNAEGEERGAIAMFAIDVDGVRIVHCGDLGQEQLTDEQVEAMGKVDVLLIPVGGTYTVDGPGAWKIVQQVEPRLVVPIHYKTDKLTVPLAPIDQFLVGMPANWQLRKPSHNTLAVAAKDHENPLGGGKVVVLDYQPWQPTGELAELLDKMDAACHASQEVFRPLSADQMNWQPPDGSHTPRWNAEHMLGRQLGFFSQIYAAIDGDTFSHIDLNPAQMPEDYEPAHPDWDGAEEARQMERANAYVRRFAYLLDKEPLDEPAPGSRWTLRQLLLQMDRHFAEHTANVKKKFDLEGWPEE